VQNSGQRQRLVILVTMVGCFFFGSCADQADDARAPADAQSAQSSTGPGTSSTESRAGADDASSEKKAGAIESGTVTEPETTDGSAAERTSDSTEVTGDLVAEILTDEEIADGWIALFDGETLFGWNPASTADWHVEQGAIVVEDGPPGLLVTTTQWSDYELKLDFLADETVNSGVFLVTQPRPGKVNRDCYELNITWGDHPYPTGGLVQRAKAQPVAPSDTWRSLIARHEQGHVVVTIDERQVLDYTDPHPLRRGHIGLQLNRGRIAFRNIKLKPLGTRSLFNGKDLSGWKTYPEMKSRFTVTGDGLLHVADGRGQLESNEQYGDFVLQLDCRTNEAQLNSGIFFRCIPGETMNGYECQIHNGVVDGDRSRPMDCGTGGFFRRQEARRVMANDQEWFTMTLVADGAHLAAWVNGFPVSDWTDTRPPDANPRRGLRLDPGTLMIQGHDPTTDISFRNLKIAELPRRAEAPAD